MLLEVKKKKKKINTKHLFAVGYEMTSELFLGDAVNICEEPECLYRMQIFFSPWGY